MNLKHYLYMHINYLYLNQYLNNFHYLLLKQAQYNYI
nr:MAG TPA: hypothetical protein [Bacteriophage sp.]